MIKTNTPVMEEFEKICQVPRCSFHNEKIIEYCINWARENGFEYEYDDVNQYVVIRKPAAAGMEDKPGIILQGHLDMVAVCDPGVSHDWENEGLDIYIDDEGFYRARGTTLGADDGVAAAISFALFKDSTLKNPPLEVLLTTDEEVGMLSVKNADLTGLKGKYLLNIDCGPEDTFVIGCCGGRNLKAIVANKREKACGNAFDIQIGGLAGGHSGLDIKFEHGNALKIMGEVLYRLSESIDFRVSALKAEGKDNAISNNAVCTIVTDATAEAIETAIKDMESVQKHIYRISDPDMFIKAEKTFAADMLCQSESRAIAFLLHALPYGVQNIEQSLKGVETSLNMGLVETDEQNIGIIISIRSSVAERSEEIYGWVKDLCSICGAECEDMMKSYPAWLPVFDSPYLKRLCEIYKDMHGEEPKVEATHGGLECGYIMAHSNIEAAVAIGPDNFGEHTPDEHLSVSSLNSTCEFTRRVVETL